MTEDFIQDFTRKMWKITKIKDIEDAHKKADSLLCAFVLKLGHEEIVEAYTAVWKWYS